jgi:hypothetical protein
MVRGRKPTPPHLRLMEGTHRPHRHGIESKAREAVAAENFGPLRLPAQFKRFAREAWKYRPVSAAPRTSVSGGCRMWLACDVSQIAILNLFPVQFRNLHSLLWRHPNNLEKVACDFQCHDDASVKATILQAVVI